MAILRKDEQTLLLDGLLAAVIDFIKARNDDLTDADIKKALAKRAMRLSTQRLRRNTDPNLAKRFAITLTGSV